MKKDPNQRLSSSQAVLSTFFRPNDRLLWSTRKNRRDQYSHIQNNQARQLKVSNLRKSPLPKLLDSALSLVPLRSSAVKRLFRKKFLRCRQSKAIPKLSSLSRWAAKMQLLDLVKTPDLQTWWLQPSKTEKPALKMSCSVKTMIRQTCPKVRAVERRLL